mgnify:CR=1 FL=1
MKSITVSTVHIGVDVSKAKLDIYVPATKEGVRPVIDEVDNNIEGFRKLRELARKHKAVICVEPTGGYELELIAFMHKFGVSVAYADALRVRQFAKAEGNHSKNDAIDAVLISRFADKIGVRIIEEPDIAAFELKRKAKFRQTMIDARTAVICRLETEIDGDMRAMLKEQIKHLNKLIAKAERSCLETVEKDAKAKVLMKRFTAVGGVGNITAISILAGLPEIGTLPDAKLNRLVGVAPEEKQSGTKEWKRRIWGGRKDVRNALYMATTASIQWNAKLGSYYNRKRAEGCPHKWAMIPTMRKMLSLLNRIARDPNFVPEPEPESTKHNAKAGRKRKAARSF